jgi:hypothetical protein
MKLSLYKNKIEGKFRANSYLRDIPNHIYGRRNRGFTLFIAIIVSSLLLSVGFSLSNIIFKQLIFSSTGKDSQIAFYAADSGVECASYWDWKFGDGLLVDREESPFSPFSNTGSGAILCGTEEVYIKYQTTNYNSSEGVTFDTESELEFHINLSGQGSQNPSCAVVIVSKSFDADPDFTPPDPEDDEGEENTDPYAGFIEATTIESRGYNARFVPGSGCQINNPRTVERAIVLTY